MRVLPLVGAAVAAAVLASRWRRLGWTARLTLLAGGAALGVLGAGVVDPPDLATLLRDVGDTLGQWTYVIVGALAFLETGAFIGLVSPGETAVVAGGVIAGQGEVEVVPLLLLVWACCVLGDTVGYVLGRRLGRAFLERHGAKVGVTEERLSRVESFFDRRGGITILVGRFVGFVRPIAPFVAGACRMPYVRFLPYDVAGSGLWATTFTLLGYFSWRNIDRAAEVASKGSLAIAVAVAAAVAVLVALRTLRTPAQRARAVLRVRRWLRGEAGGPTRHNGART